MTVTTADIITEENVRRVVEEALEENLAYRQAFRNLDVTGMDNDTLTIPKDDDTIAEPTEIPENTEFPREEEDTSTETVTVTKFGLEIPISMEAEQDSVFDVVAFQVEKKARAMQEKLNERAHNHLSGNLHTNSPTASQGTASTLEFADVAEGLRELQASGASPDLLFVSPQGYNDLLNSSEFNRATELSDQEVIREGVIGRVAGVDVVLDNDGHIGNTTSDAFMVDSDRYGYEVMKGGIGTDEYEDPSRQARVFQIWTRVAYVSPKDDAAIKVTA